MSNNTRTSPLLPTRAESLKAATHDVHQALDDAIMQFNPFLSGDNYAAFLKMQYAFHRDVAALFVQPELNALFPDLAYRARLQQVRQDLADLNLTLPELPHAAAFGADAIDIPTALGWLYVEEGSNLGGAFLFKAAAKLGFDANHGARHLAPHPEGRAPNWRTFVGQLNAVSLTADQESRVIAGASAAFMRVTSYVDSFCSTTPAN
jgi:heme oxygenase